MYGFVGVSMLNSPAKDLDPIPICKHIAEMFSAQEYTEAPAVGKSVGDYQFGDLIATGCDAAVYEVKSLPTPALAATMTRSNSVESVAESEESFEMVHYPTSTVDSETEDALTDGETEIHETTPTEDLCIKVMFNYGVSSDSSSIERAMRRELVPALTTDDTEDPLCGAHVKKKPDQQLPPHPNIVPVYGWFVDNTPLLANALDMYPIALPQRLCADGCGRNKTMFIVMERFESTLAEYLHAYGTPNVREGALILLQLLQGIQHLQRNSIAHRDLKSDNLLLRWCEGRPWLVLSDFGHCLAGPLTMTYPNDCMDKGGNAKLMAPEIAATEPGPSAILDFRSSDVWASGTIAYEIFAGVNPFYSSAFDSRTYSEADLPSLPASVPACFHRVVRGMLHRNPQQRIPSCVAISVLAVWLWGPEEWRSTLPSKVAVVRWLMGLSTAVLLNAQHTQQMALFLGNLQWCSLWSALELMAAEQ